MKSNTQEVNVNAQQSARTGDLTYFDFERLDVYRLAREHLALVAGTAIPPRLRDQLDRASDSILLNIAEGMGKPRRSRDRARFIRIALGSAKECACAWDVLAVRRRVKEAPARLARRHLLRVVAMLTRMVAL